MCTLKGSREKSSSRRTNDGVKGQNSQIPTRANDPGGTEGGNRRGRPRKKESSTRRVYSSGRWSHHEKRLFLLGLQRYGRGKWKKIGEVLNTRSLIQIKSHGQKVLQKMDAGEDVFAVLHCRRTPRDDTIGLIRPKPRREEEGYHEISDYESDKEDKKEPPLLALSNTNNCPPSNNAFLANNANSVVHQRNDKLRTINDYNETNNGDPSSLEEAFLRIGSGNSDSFPPRPFTGPRFRFVLQPRTDLHQLHTFSPSFSTSASVFPTIPSHHHGSNSLIMMGGRYHHYHQNNTNDVTHRSTISQVPRLIREEDDTTLAALALCELSPPETGPRETSTSERCCFEHVKRSAMRDSISSHRDEEDARILLHLNNMRNGFRNSSTHVVTRPFHPVLNHEYARSTIGSFTCACGRNRFVSVAGDALAGGNHDNVRRNIVSPF